MSSVIGWLKSFLMMLSHPRHSSLVREPSRADLEKGVGNEKGEESRLLDLS